MFELFIQFYYFSYAELVPKFRNEPIPNVIIATRSLRALAEGVEILAISTISRIRAITATRLVMRLTIRTALAATIIQPLLLLRPPPLTISRC